MTQHPFIIGFVSSLNEAVKTEAAYSDLPQYEDGLSLATFVLGPGGLERNAEVLKAIEEVRLGHDSKLENCLKVLNSTPDVARFALQAERLVVMGSLSLQLANVITLKGRNRFEWKFLKRCRECSKYFYGGGNRKVYCGKACERRTNNRYKPERDRVRSAHYRLTVRWKGKKGKNISKKVYEEKIYKPRKAFENTSPSD